MKELTSKKWVVQATEATQFLFYLPAITCVRGLWKKFNFGYEYVLSYVKEGFGYWLYYEKDLKDLTNYIIKKEKENPGLINSLIKEWKKDENAFYKVCTEIDKLNLRTLSDSELIKQFNSLLNANIKAWSLPIMIDAFSLYSEKIIIPLVKKAIKNKKKSLSEVLQILTSPVELSFAIEEYISFLKIVKLSRENKNTIRALKEHTKKFFWINNSYLQTFNLDEKFFAKRLEAHTKDKINIEKEIERLEKIPLLTKKEKEKLLLELDFGEELKLLLKITEQFAIWQDLRKKDSLIGGNYLMMFLDELCIRRGLNRSDMVAISPTEFSYAISGKINAIELAKRSRESFFIYKKNGVKILTESEAGKLFNILQRGSHEEINDVRGTCASPGRVQGKVKVIMGSKDLIKMNKNDILVSSMTRPELVPAMKKAAAIVTDEGGITCHAAIVSRELRIPCIIGTKVATKVLKDGDMVEVNANHGIVKKIPKDL
jgi:phosphohistidine swiveling domain-containing protein